MRAAQFAVDHGPEATQIADRQAVLDGNGNYAQTLGSSTKKPNGRLCKGVAIAAFARLVGFDFRVSQHLDGVADTSVKGKSPLRRVRRWSAGRMPHEPSIGQALGQLQTDPLPIRGMERHTGRPHPEGSAGMTDKLRVFERAFVGAMVEWALDELDFWSR